MENLKTVSALVKNILEHDHKARNTDNHLYLMVLEPCLRLVRLRRVYSALTKGRRKLFGSVYSRTS